jgi:hypothetical protein
VNIRLVSKPTLALKASDLATQPRHPRSCRLQLPTLNSKDHLHSIYNFPKLHRLISTATRIRTTHLTSLQTTFAQEDPRTLEFMSIENLKTFGESKSSLLIRAPMNRAHLPTSSSLRVRRSQVVDVVLFSITLRGLSLQFSGDTTC